MSTVSAFRVLQEAIKAVPAIKYALGIAGIISVIALIAAWGVDFRVAIFGTIIMLLLMVLLVVFAKLTTIAPRYFLIPVLVLLWSSIIITLSTAGLLFSSVFFEWPVSLRSWLVNTGIEYAEPDHSEVAIEVLWGESWKLPPGHLYRSLNFELRLINKSNKPVPINPTALFVVSGNNGNLRSDIQLEVTADGKRGAILVPRVPQSVFLEGDLSENNRQLLNKGHNAYIQLFYDESLTKEKHWYLSPFFDYNTVNIALKGD